MQLCVFLLIFFKKYGTINEIAWIERIEKMTKIAILGFGVVGSGVAKLLSDNAREVSSQGGDEVYVKYILDLRDFPDSPFGDRVVHDFDIIANDSEIDCVLEVMGGSHPAYEYTCRALRAGKSVISSNKEVVANFGDEFLKIAEENGVVYRFEAAVGGGIPVISPMISCVGHNKIREVRGILNGTTNYILTKMRDAGESFDVALAKAQKLGYAEANPSADVDGIDAARKIVILAALASGKLVNPKSIYTEGITEISLLDTKFAEKLGYAIKLIGYCAIKDGKIITYVAPHMVPTSNPLSGINDVFNGILVKADMVGEVMFYGPGAGKLPTASAVVADIIDIMSSKADEVKVIDWKEATKADIADFDEYTCKRVFIFKGTKVRVEGIHIVRDEMTTAILTEPKSEKEVKKIQEEFGDKILSVYRVLD